MPRAMCKESWDATGDPRSHTSGPPSENVSRRTILSAAERIYPESGPEALWRPSRAGDLAGLVLVLASLVLVLAGFAIVLAGLVLVLAVLVVLDLRRTQNRSFGPHNSGFRTRNCSLGRQNFSLGLRNNSFGHQNCSL